MPGVALDHREHVVEIVRDAGGQLADGLHLLRLAQLGLQVQPVGDVLDVAMHHLAGGHGMKRPGKRAPLELGFQVQHALARRQAVLDDFAGCWAAGSRADGPGRPTWPSFSAASLK